MAKHAGTLLDPPTEDSLRDAGVLSFGSEDKGKDKGKDPHKDPAAQIDALMSKLESSEGNSSPQPPAPLVTIGTGLPALPKKLIARVLANEYIDFSELPPAKGKGRPMPHSLEGQVVVVQAAELLQTRKIIPDLATWAQCFSIYTTTLCAKYPTRLPELMAYQTIIAKASQRYRWPSWVVYDQNFRQEAAGNPHQSWARVEPSIYAQCFTGQAVSTENWCSRCQCLDHTTSSCPYCPRKRQWNNAGGSGNPSTQGRQEQQICIKYNKFNGDCKFGKECRYLHICSACRELHPISHCSAGKDSSGIGNQ